MSFTTRFLSNEAGTDVLALAQDLGTQIVLKAYQEKTYLDSDAMGVVYRRNIGSGEPMIWNEKAFAAESFRQAPGPQLVGQDFAYDEVTISTYDPHVQVREVGLTDWLISPFDVVRNEMPSLGEQLARDTDKELFRVAANAARTAAKSKSGLVIHNGGNVVTAGTTGDAATAYPATQTGAITFIRDIYQLARLMDEDNIPDEGRHLFISPYLHEVILNDDRMFNRDLSTVPGDLKTRTVGKIANMMIHVSNHLPSTNITSGPAPQQGDFRFDGATGRPAAIALVAAQGDKAAIGMPVRQSLYSYIEPDETRNITFLKAQQIIGYGVLCPYLAGEIRVSS